MCAADMQKHRIGRLDDDELSDVVMISLLGLLLGHRRDTHIEIGDSDVVPVEQRHLCIDSELTRPAHADHASANCPITACRISGWWTPIRKAARAESHSDSATNCNHAVRMRAVFHAHPLLLVIRMTQSPTDVCGRRYTVSCANGIYHVQRGKVPHSVCPGASTGMETVSVLQTSSRDPAVRDSHVRM